MSGDKVLLLPTLGADYGSYFLTKGFVDLLGADRVRQWPYKHTYNGGFDHYPERVEPHGVRHLGDAGGRLDYVPYKTGSELWAAPVFWRAWKPERAPHCYVPSDAPLGFARPLGIPEESDERIFEMVADGEFGFIVLDGARWHGSAALHELQTTFGHRLPPVVFVDGEDYPQLRWDFVDAFRPAVYFKRSHLNPPHRDRFMFGRRDGLVPVLPMPFASAWDVPWVPWAEREIDVFCVFGNTQVLRRRTKEVAVEVAEAHGARTLAVVGHPLKPAEYMATLAKSKIVIDQQSFGVDTLRFWEAASSGALPLSDFRCFTPAPQIEPGVHFLQYPNDDSPNGDQQDFVRFREQLSWALTHDAEVEQMARRLYDTVREHHNCAARARGLIEVVRQQGHALAGLA